MPEFDKTTGYKMRGSKFYGHGNQSPNKMGIGAIAGQAATIGAMTKVGKNMKDDAPTDYASPAKDGTAHDHPHDRLKDADGNEIPGSGLTGGGYQNLGGGRSRTIKKEMKKKKEK